MLFVVVKDGLAADYNLTDEIVKIAGESIQSQDLSIIENPWSAWCHLTEDRVAQQNVCSVDYMQQPIIMNGKQIVKGP